MTSITVDLPDDLFLLLQRSRLAARPPAEQVKLALAIQLCQEGIISVGKAAELVGESGLLFENLLIEMGLPVVRYDEVEAERDRRNWEGLQLQRTTP